MKEVRVDKDYKVNINYVFVLMFQFCNKFTVNILKYEIFYVID